MNSYLITMLGYLAGVVFIGLPMSRLSLWLYTMEDELDFSPHKKWLKLVRDFLHPGSFGWGKRPDRRNFHTNYEGPINMIVNEYSVQNRADRLKYLILASFAWPTKLFFSLVNLAMLIVLLLIGSPFALLDWACKSLTKK